VDSCVLVVFSFVTEPAPTSIFILSLHDALPICHRNGQRSRVGRDFHHFRIGVEVGGRDLEFVVAWIGWYFEFEITAPDFDTYTEIGRAHVRTPVTWPSRMPSSARTQNIYLVPTN